MIKFIDRFTLSLICLCLAACLPHPMVYHNPTYLACKKKCELKTLACTKTCVDNCSECSTANRLTALKNYTNYVHEIHVEGGTVARQLNSYRDPLQCRKTTCNCPADYQVCIQACGGEIRKSLRVAPICR